MLDSQRSLTTLSDSADGSLRVERKAMTLRERATDVLRQAIINRRFPPGTHLKERELCELLSVSRTSVREALRHLESERLIFTVPHKGPVVASPGPEEAKAIYQVRAALEGLAGELFATHATAEQLLALEQVATRMAECATRNDPATTLATISDFYAVLFDGAGNEVCAQFIESLNARIAMFRHVTLSAQSRNQTMMDEIFEIVSAAKQRDPIKLRQACTAHVEGAYQAVLTQLASVPDSPV